MPVCYRYNYIVIRCPLPFSEPPIDAVEDWKWNGIDMNDGTVMAIIIYIMDEKYCLSWVAGYTAS